MTRCWRERCPELRSWLSASDREIPVFTGVNGTLMARIDLGSNRSYPDRLTRNGRLRGQVGPARTPERGLPGSGPDSQAVQPAIEPVGSQLSGVLPVTDVADRVTVPPLLKMTPPWAAVLPVTSL